MKRTKICDYSSYAREPILRRMKDGSLLCLTLSGGVTEPQNENVVLAVKSYDDGETWSQPSVVFSHPSRGCWSTELFTCGARDFAFVQTYNAESWYRELQTYISFCDEKGENWTEPVTAKGTVNGCSVRQGILLSNGEWLFPVYWQESRDGGFSKEYDFLKKRDFDFQKHPFAVGVVISSDGGRTFNRFGNIECDVSLWEPNAVEIEEGHIIIYCRSNKGFLVTSESFDYGRTWSVPETSKIPNPDTKVTVFKIYDTVFMVNNFVCEAGWDNRKNLCVYKSKNGKDFEFVANVDEPEKRCFYPHVAVDLKKHTVYIAYENGREHWLDRFSFDELGV